MEDDPFGPDAGFLPAFGPLRISGSAPDMGALVTSSVTRPLNVNPLLALVVVVVPRPIVVEELDVEVVVDVAGAVDVDVLDEAVGVDGEEPPHPNQAIDSMSAKRTPPRTRRMVSSRPRKDVGHESTAPLVPSFPAADLFPRGARG
jgi:hypothetical protein